MSRVAYHAKPDGVAITKLAARRPTHSRGVAGRRPSRIVTATGRVTPKGHPVTAYRERMKAGAYQAPTPKPAKTKTTTPKRTRSSKRK